jgi:tetratricopeptide (TPR) repeat protein
VTGYWRNDRTLFAHAVAVNPNSFMARDYLAFGLLSTDPAAAIKQAEIAEQLRPTSPSPHRTMATASLALGDRATAVRELRKAIRLTSSDDTTSLVQLHRLLARLLADSGDAAGAIASYRACLLLQPDDAMIETDLAAELAETGNPELAIPLYRAALRVAPQLQAAQRGLAMAESVAPGHPSTSPATPVTMPGGQ